MEWLNLIIGAAGLCLVLSGFILENIGKLKKRYSTYNWLNLIGSSFLIYYAITLKSIIFIVLNAVWMVFALYFLVKKKLQIKLQIA